MISIKRSISFILVISMLVSLFSISTFATTDVQVSVVERNGNTAVNKDDTVTFDVKVSAVTGGLASLELRLSYDNTKLEYSSSTKGDTANTLFTADGGSFTLDDTNGVYVRYETSGAGTDFNDEIVIYSATFKVLSDVGGTDISPTLAVEAISDKSANEFTPTVNQVSLTVKPATSATPVPPDSLADATYTIDDTATALDATASSPDGGEITYQWQQSTTSATEGFTDITTGGTSATYTPSTAAEGTTYYHCEVSNANANATDPSPVSAFTNVATIVVNALPPATTPTATFTATTHNGGTLGSVNAQMSYSVDGGSNWTDITSSADVDITGVTVANGIKVRDNGDGTTTSVSATQSITVTQAAAPSLTSDANTTAPTTGVATDGTITGVTTAMEYKTGSATTYTTGDGNAITGLDGNVVYYVRTKASGTVLASEDLALTVKEFSYTANTLAIGFATGDDTWIYGETPSTPTKTNENNTNTITYKYVDSANTEFDYPGTGNIPVGTYTLKAIQAADATIDASEATTTFTVTKKSLSWTGVGKATTKDYDNLTTATIDTTNTTLDLSGKIGSDVVTFTNGTIEFNTADAGVDKEMTATGFTLTGAAAGNYEIAQPTFTGTINKITPSVTVANSTITIEVDESVDPQALEDVPTGVTPNAPTSDDAGVADIVDGKIKGIAKGVVQISVVIPESTNYSEVTVNYNVIVTDPTETTQNGGTSTPSTNGTIELNIPLVIPEGTTFADIDLIILNGLVLTLDHTSTPVKLLFNGVDVGTIRTGSLIVELTDVSFVSDHLAPGTYKVEAYGEVASVLAPIGNPFTITIEARQTSSSSGGGYSSTDYYYDEAEFWEIVKEYIEEADKGDRFQVDAGYYERMPASVMELLRTQNVGLTIEWNGGEEIEIGVGEALNEQSGRVYWPLSYLEEMYDGTTPPPVTGTDDDKYNPGTGSKL